MWSCHRLISERHEGGNCVAYCEVHAQHLNQCLVRAHLVPNKYLSNKQVIMFIFKGFPDPGGRERRVQNKDH